MYTPTAGLTVQKFSPIYRVPRGLLLLANSELDAAMTEGLRGSLNAEAALVGASDPFIALFEGLNDSCLRDVRNRVLAHLLGRPRAALADLREARVIVAHDLAPSDLAQLDRSLMHGIVMAAGGCTSHSAIMVRGLGCLLWWAWARPHMLFRLVRFCWWTGTRAAWPSTPTREKWPSPKPGYGRRVRSGHGWPSCWATRAARLTELAANISRPADLPLALQARAEGIGFYRTEFLDLGRDTLPGEEEQERAHHALLEGMAGRPVMIRTLDAGGDKAFLALRLPPRRTPS